MRSESSIDVYRFLYGQPLLFAHMYSSSELGARRGGCPLKHEVGKMEEVEQIKTTRNVGNEISAQKEVREWKAR